MSLDSSENSQLAGVVVCISGDPTWDEDQNQHIREQFTDENVSRWLKYRGGRLVEEVTKATTHLICSIEAYAKKPANHKVKAARKFGCHIVTYEWLTDTLQLLDYHKRKAPPGLYHPGEVRDDEAISALFRKREKKVRPAREKALIATGFAAVSGGDDEGAGEPGKDGPEHLAAPREESTQKNSANKKPPKTSDFGGDGKAVGIVDGIRKLGNSVDNKSDKPTEKPKDGAKVDNHEPCIDIGRFSIYRDELGPYQAEVFSDGQRQMLELYESKSNPKEYLFGIARYKKPGSSKCIRYFPSQAPRDKDHELERFRSRFWRMSGKRWRQGESNLSNGSSPGRQPRPVPKTTIGSANYRKRPNELGESEESRPAKSLVVPSEQRQADLKTSFKRKSSFSESRPAKVLKVTKYSIAGGSGEANNGESKTA